MADFRKPAHYIGSSNSVADTGVGAGHPPLLVTCALEPRMVFSFARARAREFQLEPDHDLTVGKTVRAIGKGGLHLLAASVRRKALARAENREQRGEDFSIFSAMECKKVQLWVLAQQELSPPEIRIGSGIPGRLLPKRQAREPQNVTNEPNTAQVAGNA
jgi:hypothetical protein